MFKRLLFMMFGVLAATLMLTSAAPADELPVDFGLRTGYYVGTDGPFLGVEVVFPFAELVYFNPNVEYAFGDKLDTITLNADAYLEIDLPTPPGLPSPTKVWLGGGPAILIRNYDSFPSNKPGRPPHHRDDDMDLGLNAFSGVGWQADTGPMFYFQGKVVFTNDFEGVFSFGIRF